MQLTIVLEGNLEELKVAGFRVGVQAMPRIKVKRQNISFNPCGKETVHIKVSHISFINDFFYLYYVRYF